MKSLTRSLAIALLVLGQVLAVEAAPSGGQLREKPGLRSLRSTPAVSDHIIVKFKPGVSRAGKEAVHRAAGASSHMLPSADFEIVSTPAGKTAANLVAEYRAKPEVKYAELDHVMTALMVPNDPIYSYQWHLTNTEYGGIHVEPAWDRTTGAGVVVAVVDTGIAYENYSPAAGENYYLAPDLANTSFAPGYDFINNDAHPNDDEAHGTHVSGTIAQSTNNSLGVAGISHNATLMPVKVLDSAGSGTNATVAAGIRYAADHGADVINLSLGGSASPVLEEAVAYAYDLGVVIVAAAGNEHRAVSYPAAYEQVIAVAATRYDEARSRYSNYGPEIDIAAPGGDTLRDQNGDGYMDGVLQQTFDPANRADFAYYFYQGTSMASPHVAGVAALILSQNPGMTPAAVKDRLQTTAEDKGTAGWDKYYGWGLLDADAATLMPVLSLTAQSLNLASVGAGLSTWPGDNAKNKPVTIDSNIPWKLTVSAEADFSGGGQVLASSNLKMGPSYAQVVGIPTTATVEVASGSAGTGNMPDLRTTLDVPWNEALAEQTLTTTLTYTVLPQ